MKKILIALTIVALLFVAPAAFSKGSKPRVMASSGEEKTYLSISFDSISKEKAARLVEAANRISRSANYQVSYTNPQSTVDPNNPLGLTNDPNLWKYNPRADFYQSTVSSLARSNDGGNTYYLTNETGGDLENPEPLYTSTKVS